MLFTVPSGENGVSIFWADPSMNTFTLQENSDLAQAAGPGRVAAKVLSSDYQAMIGLVFWLKART